MTPKSAWSGSPSSLRGRKRPAGAGRRAHHRGARPTARVDPQPLRAGARRVDTIITDLHLVKAAIRARPGGRARADTRPRRLVRTWSEARRRSSSSPVSRSPIPSGGSTNASWRRPTRATSGLLPAPRHPAVAQLVIVPAPTPAGLRWLLEQDVEGLGVRSRPRCGWTRTIRSPAGRPTRRCWRSVRQRSTRPGSTPALSWPGHRFVVGLLESSRWLCATFETETEITKHIPNLPTKRSSRRPTFVAPRGSSGRPTHSSCPASERGSMGSRCVSREARSSTSALAARAPR